MENADLAKVTGLTATMLESGKPKLHWNKVSGAEDYDVCRATSETGTFSKIYTATSNGKTDSSAALNRVYYYKVRAHAGSKYGPYSDVKAYVPTVNVTKIANVYIEGEAKGIRISWDKIKGVKAYQIYRKGSNESSFRKIATVGSGHVQYDDSDVVNGRIYEYKIRAYVNTSAGAVMGSFCTPVSIKRMTVPTIQSSWTGPDAEYIKITWKKVTGATGYQIYYNDLKDYGVLSPKWVRLGSTTGLSYTDNAPEIHGSWGIAYKVRAYYKRPDGTYDYSAFSDYDSYYFFDGD